MADAQCICTGLKMASRVVSRAYDAAFEPLGIGPEQYSVLIRIKREGPVALMKLANELEMERTTLYRGLSLLEKQGIIKLADTGAGVARQAALTAKGRKLTAKAEARWRRVHEKFVASFGRQELAALNETLRQVREEFR
jgi:DNA-binding MarR family transcriptional regulator